MLCNYARANTNTNALIALPSNLLIPRTVSLVGLEVLVLLVLVVQVVMQVQIHEVVLLGLLVPQPSFCSFSR